MAIECTVCSWIDWILNQKERELAELANFEGGLELDVVMLFALVGSSFEGLH